MVRGTSRHVVRFVRDEERVYALKETSERDAQHEYSMLRVLAAERLPAVEAVGLVTGTATADGEPPGAVLITRYLDYSLPYRYLFSVEGGRGLERRLLDAAVVLLARLHLEGLYWGDCSLSNLLFRRDAGALMAYLVDAETARIHPKPLPDPLRADDVATARENIAGGLFDLQARGRLAAHLDVVELVDLFEERYSLLWNELTEAEEVDASDRHAIEQRIRRLNELGFDVEELIVEQAPGGTRLRIQPAVVEEGHHARELRHLTGLDVQQNQARRLLNDINSYGAYLNRSGDTAQSHGEVAGRWLHHVFEPATAKVPADLRGRLEPAELFHEMLEHRYFLAEAAGHEVSNEEALSSYFDSVLRFRPEERLVLDEELEDEEQV
jgi:hypothetical protein